MKKILIFIIIAMTVLLYGEDLNSSLCREESVEYEKVPVSLSLCLGIFSFPKLNDDSLVHLQFGMACVAPRFDFIQISAFYNISRDTSQWGQFSSLFNMTQGNFKGVQFSGIYNYAEQHVGVQFTGIYNRSSSLVGLQSGLLNSTGEALGVQLGVVNKAEMVTGIQNGVVNIAESNTGLQLGIVNVSGKARGLQIGVINIAEELDGWAMGVVNITQEGIIETGLWYESGVAPQVYTYFQTGNSKSYSLVFLGCRESGLINEGPDLVWGVHKGLRMSLGPVNYDLESGFKQSVNDSLTKNWEGFLIVPSFRSVVSFNVKNVGFFMGVDGVVSIPQNSVSNFYEGTSFELLGNDEYKVFPNFIGGFKVDLSRS
jgi:hypothetical protein